MKKNYRPEIDGLRAIAVISVIFYHAQISIFGLEFFSGGFGGLNTIKNLNFLNPNSFKKKKKK